MTADAENAMTLEEAEQLRQELTLEVQSIQAQLGDKQRTDDEGNRLSPNEYWGWKKRATHALNQKLDHLRELKQWMREKQKSHSPRVSVVEAIGHVESLCEIADGSAVSWQSDEQKQIDAAKDFLSRAKAVPAN